jgi:hypothetical protein
MPSSGMWRRVGLVRTDVSEERVASIFRVERYSRRYILEHGILHSHRCENLKSRNTCSSLCIFKATFPSGKKPGFVMVRRESLLHLTDTTQ